MELEEGKKKFIQSWGTLGTDWGINRTMAQIHALLLITPKPLCLKQVQEELNISSGNANMNIRALIDWGLVHKNLIPGERKEFFVAEKDVWEIARRIIIQRKKKELAPMIKVLNDITNVEGKCEHSDEFCQVIKDLKVFSNKADATLDRLVKNDSKWFIGTFMKMV